MKRQIEIVDLLSGAITNRKRDTLTLDVPADLDRTTGGVSVDVDHNVAYFAAGAQRRLYVGLPRRLAGRTAGEECLVAAKRDARRSEPCLHRYNLSLVH